MIGRFSKLGVYHDVLRLRDFYLAVSAADLVLFSSVIDYGHEALSMTGSALAIGSVAINGTQIIWGAIKGPLDGKVNVDELVSLAIIASLIQGEFLTTAVVSFVTTLEDWSIRSPAILPTKPSNHWYVFPRRLPL